MHFDSKKNFVILYLSWWKRKIYLAICILYTIPETGTPITASPPDADAVEQWAADDGFKRLEERVKTLKIKEEYSLKLF